MLLSAQSIRKRVGMITPFAERTLANGLTYGLGPAGYDFRIAEDVTIPPHGFLKASSVERFEIPLDLQGMVCNKSTWARRGIEIFSLTVFDPGFRGWATLEIANHSAYPIDIQKGMAIGQMIFAMLDEPTDLPYNGKFQDQPRGPQ
jgi:dCTP deaminase